MLFILKKHLFFCQLLACYNGKDFDTTIKRCFEAIAQSYFNMVQDNVMPELQGRDIENIMFMHVGPPQHIYKSIAKVISINLCKSSQWTMS